MGHEQYLIAAIATLATVVTVLFRLLMVEARDRKRELIDLRKRCRALENNLRFVQGEIKAFKLCPNGDCPFLALGEDEDSLGEEGEEEG